MSHRLFCPDKFELIWCRSSFLISSLFRTKSFYPKQIHKINLQNKKTDFWLLSRASAICPLNLFLIFFPSLKFYFAKLPRLCLFWRGANSPCGWQEVGALKAAQHVQHHGSDVMRRGSERDTRFCCFFLFQRFLHFCHSFTEMRRISVIAFCRPRNYHLNTSENLMSRSF